MAKYRHRKRGGKGKKKVTKAVKVYVKKTLKADIETKIFYLGNTDNTNFNTTGALIPIFFPIQGLTALTRLGNKVKVTNIAFRGFMQGTITAAVSSARLIFFWDSLAAGVVPSFSDVTNTNGVLQIKDPHALYSDNNRENKRYHIIKDIGVSLNLGNQATVPNRHYIHFNKRMNHNIEFFSGTGAQADLSKGAMYMLYLTDLNATGIIEYNIGVSFQDA